MRRRDVLGGTLLLPLVGTVAGQSAKAQPNVLQGAADTSFDPLMVRRMAKDLATRPYKAADGKLPEPLSNLNYDQFRTIRFNTARALWRGQNLPFEVQLLHRGFLYRDRVDLFEVADGHAQPIVYNSDLFDFGDVPRGAYGDLGFAGFRIHAPINRPDYFDEVCVFVGASYFRAVAKGQVYGLSARGLSIKTANPTGEEFPAFRAFWLERPRPGVGVVVVYALLDSQSATAAYRFTIRPGAETVFDVESAVYPRVDISEVGIGTMTSMFYFDSSGHGGIDDYRPAVHDSNGLQIDNGRGEQVWRQLANPRDLQVSVFGDNHPRGFGLMQRERTVAGFQDLEAHYEKRPSLWVEPIGDTGEGGIYLVEIPTRGEIHDNIVAFWRPHGVLAAKSECNFTYRLHWCNDVAPQAGLAHVSATRAGALTDKSRLFSLDFVGDKLKSLEPDELPKLNASASVGRILNPVVEPNPLTGGFRANFEMVPEGAKLVELRAQLVGVQGPLSEIWTYRWTA